MYDMGRKVFSKKVSMPIAKVLAVGDPNEWEDRDRVFPNARDMAFLEFEKFDETALDHYRPHSIYSQVLTRNFDCVELAERLQSLAFDGLYKAFGRNLPRPNLIEREVRQTCPNLKFKIVQL